MDAWNQTQNLCKTGIYSLPLSHLFSSYSGSHIYYNLYGYLVCVYSCAWSACGGQKMGLWVWVLWNWSWRQLWTITGLLGIESGSSGKATGALNCWTISLAPSTSFPMIYWRTQTTFVFFLILFFHPPYLYLKWELQSLERQTVQGLREHTYLWEDLN